MNGGKKQFSAHTTQPQTQSIIYTLKKKKGKKKDIRF